MAVVLKKKVEPELEKARKHLKLMKAYQNNVILSDKNLGNKFTKFEDSKLDESKTLLFEVNRSSKSYKRYFRGEIVRVKFGVNIGSEFSGDHFAIVISKGDTMMSSTLHVIPLTSKKHKKSLNVGAILYNEEEINELKEKLHNEVNNNEKRKIERVIKYYENRKEIVSYACIDHVKTISKLSVNKTLFEQYDYLLNLRCNENLLKTLDNCIMKEYTML